jgi:hypothetical protein
VRDNHSFNHIFSFVSEKPNVFNQVLDEDYIKHKLELDKLIQYMYNNEWLIYTETDSGTRGGKSSTQYLKIKINTSDYVSIGKLIQHYQSINYSYNGKYNVMEGSGYVKIVSRDNNNIKIRNNTYNLDLTKFNYIEICFTINHIILEHYDD